MKKIILSPITFQERFSKYDLEPLLYIASHKTITERNVWKFVPKTIFEDT